MNELSQLRNNIDFASISQFLHTFQSAFGPWTHQLDYPRSADPLDDRFETEDLEDMFLQASSRPRLEDMVVRMLRTLTRNRFINQSSWQNYFAKEFDKREFDQENPFYTTEIKEQVEEQQTIEERVAVNYFTLPLDTKLHLIHLLCEWQLDEPEKLREHLETEDDCIQWRVDPIGFDKRGDIFWLFDDNRLYKESLTKPRPKKKPAPKKRHTAKGSRKSSRNAKQQEDQLSQQKEDQEDEEEWKPWKLLCATSAEWEHIPERFAQSTHVDEKRFHDLLVNDVLPKVLPAIIEHEKELKKREAIIHRKRSSRIMIKELEALSAPEINTTTTATSGRASSRIEEKATKREEEEKEKVQKAREERLLEREKRTMEREYRRLAREKKGEDGDNDDDIDVQNMGNGQSENGTPAIPPLKLIVKPSSSSDGKKRKRGRKPKARNADQDEDSWEFECICGVKGENLDDGSPMIACEQCGVWQHIKCLRKYGQVHANKKTLDSITFVCRSCKIKNGEEVEPIRQFKRQKTNKQQKQHDGDQVTLPSIQIWDRLQSPQITIISQSPLQPQPTRPILQLLPPQTIQPNHQHPILHPILEPRPTVAAQHQPPILEPQPSILEPSFQSHRPHPILPQPVLPPPQQQPVSKPSILPNTIPSHPPLIRPLASSFQPPSKPIIPGEPRPVAATTALEAQPAQNVTPTQSFTDVTENNVTLENQEKLHAETVPSLPNNNS